MWIKLTQSSFIWFLLCQVSYCTLTAGYAQNNGSHCIGDSTVLLTAHVSCICGHGVVSSVALFYDHCFVLTSNSLVAFQFS